MATSAIFKYANDISMNRSANSARSVTTGGYARTHRLGPSVMSFEADLPLLTEEQFREVENELFSIDDGIKFLNVIFSISVSFLALIRGENLSSFFDQPGTRPHSHNSRALPLV